MSVEGYEQMSWKSNEIAPPH